MLRKASVLISVLLTAAVCGPASATQQVGVQRYLSTSFDLRGRDGLRYTVDLVATEAGVGQGLPSTLEVVLHQCGAGGSCRALGSARLALPAGAVTVSPDLTSGTLRATLSGLPIEVRLTHAYAEVSSLTVNGAGVDVYSLETTTTGPSPRAGAYVLGEGRGALGRAQCALNGELGSMQGLDREGQDVRDPRPATLSLPKPVLAALRSASC